MNSRPLTPALSPGKARGEGAAPGTPATHLASMALRQAAVLTHSPPLPLRAGAWSPSPLALPGERVGVRGPLTAGSA